MTSASDTTMMNTQITETNPPRQSPAITTPPSPLFPRQHYREREFYAQIDLSFREKAVLYRIHRLDSGTDKGCHVSNGWLAAKLYMGDKQLLKAIQVLNTQGYLVNLGFDDINEVAYRRVRLKYAKIPGVNGVYTLVPGKNGRMKKRWRKTGEPDPSICLREELPARLLQIKAAGKRGAPATTPPASTSTAPTAVSAAI